MVVNKKNIFNAKQIISLNIVDKINKERVVYMLEINHSYKLEIQVL
jgi:hypothetical protein